MNFIPLYRDGYSLLGLAVTVSFMTPTRIVLKRNQYNPGYRPIYTSDRGVYLAQRIQVDVTRRGTDGYTYIANHLSSPTHYTEVYTPEDMLHFLAQLYHLHGAVQAEFGQSLRFTVPEVYSSVRAQGTANELQVGGSGLIVKTSHHLHLGRRYHRLRDFKLQLGNILAYHQEVSILVLEDFGYGTTARKGTAMSTKPCTADLLAYHTNTHGLQGLDSW